VQAKTALQPVLDDLDSINSQLVPYEQIKKSLTAARACYRELSNAFVDELKARCTAMTDDAKQALVLELFAQDIRGELDAAVGENRHGLIRLIERLWDKYFTPMSTLLKERNDVVTDLATELKRLGYVS
jgi:type I restriction enzyme M protein